MLQRDFRELELQFYEALPARLSSKLFKYLDLFYCLAYVDSLQSVFVRNKLLTTNSI